MKTIKFRQVIVTKKDEDFDVFYQIKKWYGWEYVPEQLRNYGGKYSLNRSFKNEYRNSYQTASEILYNSIVTVKSVTFIEFPTLYIDETFK